MSVRLGEMLLHGGALTEEQLEEALSAQSAYGGRLGTNLVEMGLLSEEDLARLLFEKLGVPSVDMTRLEVVPESLIAVLPTEMVRRFRVLPVALDGKRLTLAMSDPADFSAIDEIGFATGLVIVPRVCSELRLSMALEHYYGIKRALRFIPVAGGLRTRMARLNRDGSVPPEVGADPAVEAPPGGNRRHDTSTATPDPGAPPSVGAFAEKAAATVPSCIDAIARKFVAAAGEAEVLTTLMSYLKAEFNRAGLLCLRRGSALGVQAFNAGVELPGFPGCVLELQGAILLRGVLEKKEPYLGTLPEEAEGQLLAKMGAPPGGTALLMPLVVNGVSVAFLILEDAKGRLAPGLFDLQRVVAKAGLAFEMVSIRKRIAVV